MPKLNFTRFSDRDLDFLVETVHPEVVDKLKLRQIIKEDEEFRNTFLEDEKVFRRVMDEEEVFLKISPILFFEILLRRTLKEMKEKGYTIEKTSKMRIPVFDTKPVIDFFSKRFLLDYLANMLSSFTKIENYIIWIKSKTGILERFQFNDLDFFSLKALCEDVDEEHRLGFYKRLADICLFILGIFPDYAEYDYRYPFTKQLRPQFSGKIRISPEEYEKEGQRYYRLAAEHKTAQELGLSEIFWDLHENFQKAKKPLNFISENYLSQRKHKIF